MASSICISPSPPFPLKNAVFPRSFPSLVRTPPSFLSLKAKRSRWSNQSATDLAVLRKFSLTSSSDVLGNDMFDEDEWLHWEDRILEETVPLVAFVRTILQPGRYQSGDRLSADHEKTILESLLPYHPGFKRKIGCGIDFITIGYHPDFENSRCLFIVRKDGELVDFSYWKCIKGLIRKKYPLYADSFIGKHFRRGD